VKNIKVPPPPKNFLATELRGGDGREIICRLIFFKLFKLFCTYIRRTLEATERPARGLLC